MNKVMIIYGTRPEAVKLAPLIRALRDSDVFQTIVVSTGQHREMLKQVNDWFGVSPDTDMNVFQHGATLTEVSERILHHLPGVLEQYQPDAVVVQGDTTTVAISALACFYHQVPVVHLEAGLRSGDINSPFPEEANRRIAGQVTALHLAPTSHARDNLLRENVEPATISVVGNTVIDALRWTSTQPVSFGQAVVAEALAKSGPKVLVTTHRRENWGRPMTRIAEAVATLARQRPHTYFIVPMHKNPKVRDALTPALTELENVVLCEPLDYPEFVHVMKNSHIVLSDSGGVQEEAPSLGRPVLVLRENTERPEAVEAGTVRLIGTATADIVAATEELLDDPLAYKRMSQAVNPYGDGKSAQRSVAAIAELLGVGKRMPEFSPDNS